jgi:DNA-binding NarL/FixJ family response regulator
MKTGPTRRGQRPEVAESWPQPPPDLELSIVWIDGEELAVLSHRLDSPASLAGLTEAERQVAADVIDGFTNEQIATRRGTSSRTIAKQVASIFRKLGVGSRRQLFAKMKRPARTGRTPVM